MVEYTFALDININYMQIGILGSGFVGQTIGSALINKGHIVMMGSRNAANENAIEWSKQSANASYGTFQNAMEFGEIIFICINGSFVKETLEALNKESVSGKTIIDVTNPLDFSKGMPASLLPAYSNRWSLGEEIQQLLPEAFVVKALNTVTARLMVNAELINDGNHQMCICGNDTDAKNKVKHLLAENFLWKPEFIVDMGGIESARLMEAVVPYWLGIMQVLGTPLFNYQIVR